MKFQNPNFTKKNNNLDLNNPIFFSVAMENLRRSHISLKKKQMKGEEEKPKEHNYKSKIINKIWYERTYKQFCTREELYRPFFLISFLAIVQQFSGMSVMRSYVVKIFHNIGR